MNAAARIDQFLRDHPDSDLLVAVGYTTPAGMAWLAQRTAGRRVCLLIGDTRSKWWTRSTVADKTASLNFMNRPDVEIRNWYRTSKSRQGAASAHLKVWAAHHDWRPASALVGSGNLTRQGLAQNVEVMVEAHGNDLQHTWDTAHELWGKAWGCEERLMEYLTNSGAPERQRHNPQRTGRRQPNRSRHQPPSSATTPAHSRRPSRTTPDRQRRHPQPQRGCLEPVAGAAATVAVLAALAGAIVSEIGGLTKLSLKPTRCHASRQG